MSVRALPVVLITMIAIAPLAAADDHDHGLHGGDFALFVHDHGDGLEIEIEPRVLGAELDPGLGFAATSPGFDSAPGAFPTGSSVGIDITQALMRWTGAAFVALDSLSQETMTAAFLTLSATTGDGPVAGFAINLDGDGSWHKHLSFILNGADGADPADGVYLFSFTLRSSNVAIGDSEPAWIVFNLNGDEAAHDAAIAWVRSTLVPEPMSFWWAGAVALAATWRRR